MKEIGLLGGSFNPAHKGHIYISEQALDKLKLDEVWWLINPQNPFKIGQAMMKINDRVTYANKLNSNPKIKIMDLENIIGTRYTYDTLQYLKKHYSNVNFTWILGDDLIMNFHQWKNWTKIIDETKIAIFTRNYDEATILNTPAGVYMKMVDNYHYFNIRPMDISSTQIRNKQLLNNYQKQNSF